jgi:DNA-directed RNA polymerase subunit M/transcription elongation factor TFIIS
MEPARSLSLIKIKRFDLGPNVAVNIEKSIFNTAIERAEEYGIDADWEKLSFKNIYSNLVMQVEIFLTSEKVRQKIKDKTLNSREIAKELPHNIFPEEWCEFEENSTLNVEDVEDGVFTCHSCGSKKTSYYSLQTRSADEPMTNFITCVICKNRWKM